MAKNKLKEIQDKYREAKGDYDTALKSHNKILDKIKMLKSRMTTKSKNAPTFKNRVKSLVGRNSKSKSFKEKALSMARNKK